MKRPPVSWLSVPPLIAKATGVRYSTGETPMPVVSPSGTTRQLAAQRFLVDRNQPSAAGRIGAENTQNAVAGPIQDLDDPPGMANDFFFIVERLDPKKNAIANSGDLCRLGTPRRHHPDFGRGAVLLLIPFVGKRNQFAVAITFHDIGQRDGSEGAGAMQLLAPIFDLSFVGQFAQDALQPGASLVLQMESACNLARPDFSGSRANKGQQFTLAGEGWLFLWSCLRQ